MTDEQDKIRQVRERTGQGLVECQRALAEAAGDVERAVELIRLRGEMYTAHAKEAFNALIERFKKDGGAEADG